MLSRFLNCLLMMGKSVNLLDMETQPLILSIDLGSQSLRCSLVDKCGESVLSSCYRYNAPFIKSDIPGYAEQEPLFYYEALKKACRSLFEQDPDFSYRKRIKAVILSCIRDTVVLLDKDKKPLRNIITWMDCRRAQKKAKISFPVKVALFLVGMKETFDMLYKNSYYNWIAENEKEILEKTDKFVLISTYMNYLLTGVLADSTSGQVGHIPYDYKNRKWLTGGLTRHIAPVPVSKLCDLVEVGKVIGKITEKASEDTLIPAGLDLIAGGTDKTCETLGLSVLEPDKAAVSLGTAATIEFSTSRYFTPAPFLPSYPAVVPGYYNVEYQLYRGYWSVTWFVKEFCQKEIEEAQKLGVIPEKILDSFLEEVPAGCNGLLITPHFAPGSVNPFAKGVVTGLTDEHGKKHIYRALIEGITFDLFHAMKKMERRGRTQIKEIYIAGGGGSSDTIMQIFADIFGLPAKRIQTREATGLGAAVAAFTAIGEFSSYGDALTAMVHDKDVFYPNMDLHNFYMDIYIRVYKQLERRNTGLFRIIRKIQSRSVDNSKKHS